jgi:hypothetical protein
MHIAVKTAAGIAVASALLVGSPLVAHAEDVNRVSISRPARGYESRNPYGVGAVER